MTKSSKNRHRKHDDRRILEYIEEVESTYCGDPKRISNFIMNDLLRIIHSHCAPASALELIPAYLEKIIQMVDDGTLNSSTGKVLLNWRPS